MLKFRNFAEVNTALSKLYKVYTASSIVPIYTLDRIRTLLEYLGNPQNALKVIHVAGTSGKTSTVYYLSALLEEAGATVGMTVSPHINEVNERVQINHVPLAEAEFCREFSVFMKLVVSSGVEPSYFELLVAFAFWKFARDKVDYAVIEVGLGGLLDGTNVIDRADKVCVITDIGYDHVRVLGNTLAEIAMNKAGIIQRNNQVFMYAQAAEIMQAVNARVQSESANLTLIEQPAESSEGSLPLYQQRNLYLAEQVADWVLQRDDRPRLSAHQRHAAAAISIPGRMETVTKKGKTIIFDGAHNAQKMRALVDSVAARYPDAAIAALTASVSGDDDRWQEAMRVLAPAVTQITVTSFELEQDMPKSSMAPDIVSGYLSSLGHTDVIVQPDLATACRELLQRPDPLLLVTGSLYLLSAARRCILELI